MREGGANGSRVLIGRQSLPGEKAEQEGIASAVTGLGVLLKVGHDHVRHGRGPIPIRTA
jgi:hypothetical protein